MSKNRLNPHDRFTKAMMTNKKVVREFFEVYLPDNIKSILDFSSMQPQRDSFVDDKLRLQIADLLYEVKFNGEAGFIYLLLEHASTPDKMLPFRMAKYMMAIMDQHLKKTQSGRLPFIYPLILYTGDKPYPYSMDLWDMFGSEKDLAKETMMNPYPLIDLTQVSDDELKKYLWFGTMGLMLKHVHDADILPLFRNHFQIFRKLEKEGGEEYIYTILSYVVEAAEVSSKEEFLQAIKQLESVNEEKVMTIVEQLKPEVYKRGIEKGKLEAFKAITLALNLFKEGKSVTQIAEATELSLLELEDLKKQVH